MSYNTHFVLIFCLTAKLNKKVENGSTYFNMNALPYIPHVLIYAIQLDIVLRSKSKKDSVTEITVPAGYE